MALHAARAGAPAVGPRGGAEPGAAGDAGAAAAPVGGGAPSACEAPAPAARMADKGLGKLLAGRLMSEMAGLASETWLFMDVSVGF